MVPSVAPDGMTMFAGAAFIVLTTPLPAFALRKSKYCADTPTVIALAATDALTAAILQAAVPVKPAAVVAVAAFPPILKFATGVVDDTTNGAVPVATFEVRTFVTVTPDAVRLFVTFTNGAVSVPEVLTLVNTPVTADTAFVAVTADAVAVPVTPSEAEFNVVNVAAFADVPPMTGGDAKREVTPTPDTEVDAVSVVNAPVPAVVLPIAGGDANSAVMPAPDTDEDADRLVNSPVDCPVTPIDVLFISPPVKLTDGDVSVLNDPVEFDMVLFTILTLPTLPLVIAAVCSAVLRSFALRIWPGWNGNPAATT